MFFTHKTHLQYKKHTFPPEKQFPCKTPEFCTKTVQNSGVLHRFPEEISTFFQKFQKQPKNGQKMTVFFGRVKLKAVQNYQKKVQICVC
jgi:hypothetical protein